MKLATSTTRYARIPVTTLNRLLKGLAYIMTHGDDEEGEEEGDEEEEE